MSVTDMPDLRHKNLSAYGVTSIDEEKGIVEAFVAGIGNKDSVDDIIEPGAFVDSLKARMPKGVWSHDWNRPVSKTLEIEEVPAGDPRLPQKMLDAKIGGLYVKTQFNLETQDGRDAFSWVKFYDTESEWSIGYQVADAAYDTKKKAMRLKAIDLFEYSPVLFGANPLTSTVGVKVHGSSGDAVELKLQGVDEEMAEKIAKAIDDIVAAADAEVDAEVKSEEEEDGIQVKTDEEEMEVKTDEVDEDAEAPKADADTDDDASDEDEDEDKEDETVEVVEDVDAEGEKSDSADSDKAAPVLSAVVSFAQDMLKSAELTAYDAQTLTNFINSRVEEKIMVGSFDYIRKQVCEALCDMYENAYVWVHSVFDSKVVYCVSDWRSDDGPQYYESTYTIDDAGEVTFGDAANVDVVEVVVAKNALIDAAFKGHGADVKVLLRPLVDLAADVESANDEYTKTMEEGFALKAGATLSAANKKKLEDALASIEAASEAIEMLIGVDDDETAEKSADSDLESKEDGAEAEAKSDEATNSADISEPVVLDPAEYAEFKSLADSLEAK